MDKSIAELIDELSIVNIKVFMLNEVATTEKDDHKVAEASRKMVILMQSRSALKHAIARKLGDTSFKEVKQYG